MKKDLSAREFLKHAKVICDDHIQKCEGCDDCPMFSLNAQENYCLGATHSFSADEMIKDVENAYKKVAKPKELSIEKVVKRESRKMILSTIKKLAITFFCIIGAASCISFFIFVGFDLKKRDFYYSEKGVIKDNKTIITEDGNIWKYDTNYKKDTKVTVKLHTNDTGSINDDVVIDVKKITP